MRIENGDVRLVMDPAEAKQLKMLVKAVKNYIEYDDIVADSDKNFRDDTEVDDFVNALLSVLR